MSSRSGSDFWASSTFALSTLDQVNDLIITVDRVHHCRFANQAARKWFPTSTNQIVGRHLGQVLGQEAFDQLREGCDHGLAGATSSQSGWVRLKDGEQALLECRFVPCHDGDVSGVAIIICDLTAQARNQEARERGEQRLKDFAEIASDWLWEMDADLRFTWFSANVEEKTGVPAEWHYGKTREEIASPNIDRAALAEHLKVLEARQPYRDFRLARRGPDGDRWISSSGKPIFDRSGAFIGYRGIGTDITTEVLAGQAAAKQEELEAALAEERQLSAMQRQFIALVSHEFRTPLAIIDGNAHRLLRHEKAPKLDRLKLAVGKIRGAVGQMIGLMESVLSASRLESGHVQFEPTEVLLADLLADVSAIHAEIATEHEISVDVDRLTCPIIGDERLLRQVFSNLLSNAVKYSPTGTTISVEAELRDLDYAVISVRDQGIGIPEDEVDDLCKRFFRASTSTGIAGTGIGLHLVKSLVDMHGGSVDVSSTVGGGSTFTICLPLAKANRLPKSA